MANQHYIDVLPREGVKPWNLWHEEEATIRRNLHSGTRSQASLAVGNGQMNRAGGDTWQTQ
jgi:hypothetical protein